MTYSAQEFPPFAVTVDLAVLTLRAGRFCILLITRGEEPFRGRLALPGGFVRVDESADAAARRELLEETGVATFDGHIEQLATYSDPARDPRMRVVSVAYVAFAPDLPEPRAGTDAADAAWVPVDEIADGLAFDHRTILDDAIERVRAKLEYSTLATQFVGDEFTLRDLQTVYETVWGVVLDRANFRRKVLGTPDVVRAVSGATASTGARGRHAQVYRAGDASLLYPPILRG
ncbi:NUDIX hydrolase [Williamsia sp. Leaf354]|uniref:NUDIX hydrolase n=1 Tax=Williamsia sp. Leaf354 TaxID=1736349 RepID=UPI0006FC0E0E|nr:NUDIX domain-containing protein [Williamsia sp. Leaf354]KQS00686.1 NUDIX hydrolase [Williamsia sp. Leaf354]